MSAQKYTVRLTSDGDPYLESVPKDPAQETLTKDDIRQGRRFVTIDGYIVRVILANTGGFSTAIGLMMESSSKVTAWGPGGADTILDRMKDANSCWSFLKWVNE